MTTVPATSPSATQARPSARSAQTSGGRGMSVALAVCVGIAFLALFYRWFMKQGEFSSAMIEDWGHSFFIPFISGYMVWQRRREIAASAPHAFWPGLVPTMLGIAAYLTFSIGPIPGVHMFQGLSVIVTLFGIALTLFGPGTMRHLFLPIAFLGFGVTVAERIMLEITWPLQIIASQGAFVMLGVVGMIGGFQVEVDGNILTVITGSGEEIPLNVAQACSGMRMVVAFIALGATVAVLTCRLWWQRIAVMLLSIPVALLMNILRVAVLGLLTLEDRNLAQGEAHTLIGTLLLFPGLGVFLLTVWALKKIVDLPPLPKPSAGYVFSPNLARSSVAALLVVLSVSALGIGWTINAYQIHLDKKPIYAPNNRVLSALPIETDNWVRIGEDRIESAEVLEELGTTNYLNRVFIEKNPPEGQRPRAVEFHAAYYTDQIDTVPHVPERCFVGGGMQRAAESTEIPVGLDTSRWLPDPLAPPGTEPVFTARTSTRWSDSRGQRVRLPAGIEHLRIRTSGYSIPRQGDIYAGYFFIANGGVVASAEDVRLLAFDLKDDYAFYLKVQFNAVESDRIQSPQDLAEAAGDLLEELLPDIMLCVPDWVEVTQGRYPLDRDTPN